MSACSDGPVTFVPGHRLSEALYAEVVGPVLADRFPRMPYAAALLGHGSDVLGYDTARSADHDWGPRLTVVLGAGDLEEHRDAVLDAVEAVLPERILGVAVDHLGSANRPDGEVTYTNSAGRSRPHGVTVDSVPGLLASMLDLAGTGPGDLDPAAWLSLPQQSLLELTAGPCLRDDTGQLTTARERLAFYPHDVWLHLMAARWQRIAQLEAFVGRTGELGDDLGSHLVTASLLRDVLHLALLQERRYAPYAKWLGTAYRRSNAAVPLDAHLTAARTATTWQDRAAAVVGTLGELGRRHDALGVTEPVGAEARTFFDRPYRVLFVEQYADALRAAVSDPAVQRLPHDVGGIDTLTDSTLALANPSLRRRLRDWWRQA